MLHVYVHVYVCAPRFAVEMLYQLVWAYARFTVVSTCMGLLWYINLYDYALTVYGQRLRLIYGKVYEKRDLA